MGVWERMVSALGRLKVSRLNAQCEGSGLASLFFGWVNTCWTHRLWISLWWQLEIPGLSSARLRFCGHWDLSDVSVLKENSELGVFGGGCHPVSSLTTSLALHAAGILSVFWFTLLVYKRRDLEGRVSWQDSVLWHTLTQECWVQAPDEALFCVSVNPAIKWGW